MSLSLSLNLCLLGSLFCQAQPKPNPKLSWAEIALLSELWGTYIYVAAAPIYVAAAPIYVAAAPIYVAAASPE